MQAVVSVDTLRAVSYATCKTKTDISGKSRPKLPGDALWQSVIAESLIRKNGRSSAPGNVSSAARFAFPEQATLVTLEEHLEERIIRLSARVVGSAWRYLQQFRGHPLFPELVAQIEKIEGQLIEADIDGTLRRIAAQRSRKRTP